MIGKLINVQRNLLKGGFDISFRVNDIKGLPDQEDLELEITVKKKSKKRSTKANAYMWTLLQKIAVVLESTKEEIYLEYLRNYGEFTPVRIEKRLYPNLLMQWREVEVIEEYGDYLECLCYFGSSTFNSSQMNRVLNAITDDCHSLGIDTISPEELERILKQYEKEINNSKRV